VIAALLSDLWPYIAALLAAAVAGWRLYAKGGADQRLETTLDAAERYAKTRKDMDDADAEIHGADPDAARRWLHERGKPGGDL
jgi:hypothetical protein